ncbi:MAG: response regulator [Rhodospirillaceae bacterium]|nr:response regulator [Rhodospirillaceae bacterium]
MEGLLRIRTKIVVVDNYDVVREWLCELLRAFAEDVESAGSLGDVQRLLERERGPVLVVLDMALSHGDDSPEPGFRVLEWMQKEKLLGPQRCQVTVVSGHLGGYRDAVRAMGTGAVDVVSKPFRTEIDLVPKLARQDWEARRSLGW